MLKIIQFKIFKGEALAQLTLLHCFLDASFLILKKILNLGKQISLLQYWAIAGVKGTLAKNKISSQCIAFKQM